jgi:hypothetical protein
MKNYKDLTLDNVKELTGKTIEVRYPGYKHQGGTKTFVVGEVISEYEYAKRDTSISNPNFANRAEYWESFMDKKEIQGMKQKICILTAEGKNTFIRAYSDEGIFWCGDSDRYVDFRIIDEN